MRALIQKLDPAPSPESLLERLRAEPGVVLLRSSPAAPSHARCSFVTARPFLTFQSRGSRCETRCAGRTEVRFGDPWRLLEALLSAYELRDELDLPFPLGGCFGYWGYDLKNFLEPRLPRRAVNDLEFPDCHVGFYDSLVAFDHLAGAAWILSTGLDVDASRSTGRARQRLEDWNRFMSGSLETRQAFEPVIAPGPAIPSCHCGTDPGAGAWVPFEPGHTNMTQSEYLAKVARAQAYIRAGDIYQVNLSHRLTRGVPATGPVIFHALHEVSPAPFSAYLDGGDFQILSASPELFLKLNGAQIQTCPIKGTRPRSAEPAQDAQLAYQLQTSPKEMAELVMITDLLRNDLGKVCEFGSIQVSDLARLERFPQVQHLVSTVEGRLRPDVSHLNALAACFPGGSVTGAPKVRAMEIIDELEPVSRGPYTGALGYLGFNRESQLSMIIRTALCKDGLIHFQTGAGIVADSIPEAEYAETLAKARGFIAALGFCSQRYDCLS